MIKENLDNLIRESILAKTTIRTNVLRAIKTKFMEVETAKNAKPLDEQAVIRKMISDRINSAEIYNKAGRKDLAANEQIEIEHLMEFKEEGMSDEDIKKIIANGIGEGIDNMGMMMRYVKTNAPSADMKLVSTLVKLVFEK